MGETDASAESAGIHAASTPGETGANTVRRFLKVDIVTLVWTVILAPKEAATVTLAGMKTVFELFDLGYFCFDLSRKIDQVGAFFVSRLKANANPTIVKDLTSSGSGRRRCLVGN